MYMFRYSLYQLLFTSFCQIHCHIRYTGLAVQLSIWQFYIKFGWFYCSWVGWECVITHVLVGDHFVYSWCLG